VRVPDVLDTVHLGGALPVYDFRLARMQVCKCTADVESHLDAAGQLQLEVRHLVKYVK
jgi:hypothetical protein